MEEQFEVEDELSEKRQIHALTRSNQGCGVGKANVSPKVFASWNIRATFRPECVCKAESNRER